MNAIVRIALIAWFVIPAAGRAESAEPAPPEAVVATLEQALIENMQAASDRDFQARFDDLRPLMADIMAVERMARYLFGRDWRGFEAGQREAFIETFLDLSAATYANQFDAYNGERFSAVEVQHPGEDRALVRRRLTTGSGRKVAFDYLMTRSEDRWRIVTIVTDGVSDLALKRSQYQRILDDQGFDAVVDHVREAVERQREG